MFALSSIYEVTSNKPVIAERCMYEDVKIVKGLRSRYLALSNRVTENCARQIRTNPET